MGDAESTSARSVSMTKSASFGSSYGAEMPVKLFRVPARALAKRPSPSGWRRASRASQTSTGAFSHTCMKRSLPIRSFARARSDEYGLTKAAMVSRPASLNSLAVSAARRLDSERSSAEKLRSLLMPRRICTPSKTWVAQPSSQRRCSSAYAMVLFPDRGNPVSQTVEAGCP